MTLKIPAGRGKFDQSTQTLLCENCQQYITHGWVCWTTVKGQKLYCQNYSYSITRDDKTYVFCKIPAGLLHAEYYDDKELP